MASAHFAQSISSIDIPKCINFELKWWTNIDRCTQIWLSDKNDMQWHWSTESEYAHCGFSIKICPMFDTKLNSCSSFSVAGKHSDRSRIMTINRCQFNYFDCMEKIQSIWNGFSFSLTPTVPFLQWTLLNFKMYIICSNA